MSTNLAAAESADGVPVAAEPLLDVVGPALHVRGVAAGEADDGEDDPEGERLGESHHGVPGAVLVEQRADRLLYGGIDDALHVLYAGGCEELCQNSVDPTLVCSVLK